MVDRFRAHTCRTLFRRVFLINGLVFVLGTLVLALSPATVSARMADRDSGTSRGVGRDPGCEWRSAAIQPRTSRLELRADDRGATALAAQEGERQRIARELHDEIGQSLTVVLLTLKRAVDKAPEDLRDDLNRAGNGALQPRRGPRDRT